MGAGFEAPLFARFGRKIQARGAPSDGLPLDVLAACRKSVYDYALGGIRGPHQTIFIGLGGQLPYEQRPDEQGLSVLRIPTARRGTCAAADHTVGADGGARQSDAP